MRTINRQTCLFIIVVSLLPACHPDADISARAIIIESPRYTETWSYELTMKTDAPAVFRFRTRSPDLPEEREIVVEVPCPSDAATRLCDIGLIMEKPEGFPLGPSPRMTVRLVAPDRDVLWTWPRLAPFYNAWLAEVHVRSGLYLAYGLACYELASEMAERLGPLDRARLYDEALQAVERWFVDHHVREQAIVQLRVIGDIEDKVIAVPEFADAWLAEVNEEFAKLADRWFPYERQGDRITVARMPAR